MKPLRRPWRIEPRTREILPMLLIDCPYCGSRPELEFSHGGQAHIARPGNPAEVSAQDWTDFLYMRSNIKGVHAERWRHTHGCGRFFNALRDTTTDHFLATYKAGQPAPGGTGKVGP
jgi:sarcosine oxidase, subunit delta